MNKWISVSTQMPKAFYGILIVALNEGVPYVCMGYYDNRINQWCKANFDETGDENPIEDLVTHWMPLPNPPHLP